MAGEPDCDYTTANPTLERDHDLDRELEPDRHRDRNPL
jgi:hypothetical protein